MIVWILVAAGAVLLFWPSSKQESSPYLPQPKTGMPSYIAAVSALQTVRHRLVETEQLGDPQVEAIDALTLALVRGSER